MKIASKIYAGLLALVLVLGICAPSVQAATETYSFECTFHQTSARSMLQMVNDFRTLSDVWYWNEDNTTKTYPTGLKTLTYDYGLEKVAMQRAAEIIALFDHARPDGATKWSNVVVDGVSSCGENIAAGSSVDTPDFTFELWREEDDDYSGQGHRRNMLYSGFRSVGIAHVEYKGYHYWVQEFGFSNSGKPATSALDSETTMSVEVNTTDAEYGIVLENRYGEHHYMDEVTAPVMDASLHIILYDTFGPGVEVPSDRYKITYSTDNTSVAVIENGQLKLTGEGKTNVICKTTYNGQNYEASYPINVYRRSLYYAELGSIADITYSGVPATPVPEVTMKGKTLKQGVDFEMEYYMNDACGTAYYRVNGIGCYTGTVGGTFTINQVSVNDLDIKAIPDQAYTGSAILPEVSIYSGKNKIDPSEYHLTYMDNSAVGTATVRVTGRGNLKDITTVTFNIVPADISGAKISAVDTQISTGKEIKPSVVVTLGNNVLVSGTDYTVTYKNNKAPGTAVIEVAGKGNYTGKISSSFTIKAPTPTSTPVPKPTVTSAPGVTKVPGVTTVPAVTTAPGVTSVPGVTSAPGVTTKPDPTSAPDVTSVPVKDAAAKGVEGFVERLYTVALNREFDEDGKAHWVKCIKTEGMSGAQAAYGFLLSPEFEGRGLSDDEFVEVLYKTFFDRESDEGGKANWVGVLADGDSRQSVIEGFVNSTEWANLCLRFGIDSGGLGVPDITIAPSEEVRGFATRLYSTCLGREPDPDGLEYWAYEIANRRVSGSLAARGFFFSDEFVGYRFDNSEYVTRLYRTFMDREPDDAGMYFWLEYLQSGKTRADVFDGFAGSPEWAGICSSYGIVK